MQKAVCQTFTTIGSFPFFNNEITKKDVKKDVQANKVNTFSMPHTTATKPHRMEDFVNRLK